MNLLTPSAGQSDTVSKHIFAALGEMNITGEDMVTAEAFFDFTKDIDVSLLDKIKYRYIPKNSSGTKTVDAYIHIYKTRKYLYFDRYILFLDALVGYQIADFIFYYSSNMNSYYKSENDFTDMMLHAYSQRYGESDAAAKLSAAFAYAYATEDRPDNNAFLSDAAVKSPESLYRAYKYYCVGDCFDVNSGVNAVAQSGNSQRMAAAHLPVSSAAKVALCSVALQFDSMSKRGCSGGSTADVENISRLSPEHAAEMAEYISSVFMQSIGDFKNYAVFELVTTAMFKAGNYGGNILNTLKANISGKETYFLAAMFMNSNFEYFAANIDAAAGVIGLSSEGEFAVKCVKTAIMYSWSEQSSYGRRGFKCAEIWLKYCAERFPRSMAEVMYSMDEVQKAKGISWAYVQDKYYCCFYHEIYTYLNEYNPGVISECNIDYSRDIVDLTIKTELARIDIAHEEIENYLRGKAGLSSLEPYFDKLADAYTGWGYENNRRLLGICSDKAPAFFKRHLCLTAIEYPYCPVSRVVDKRGSTEAMLNVFKETIDIFNEGNVPIRFRFNVYDMIIDRLYSDSDKSSIGDILVQKMIDRRSGQDEEYKSFCGAASVFVRKAYIKYLAAAGTENKADILKVFGDSSKEVRAALVETMSEHKEFEDDVVAQLGAKKAAVRETAVDILTKWGADKYRDSLLKTAENEKSGKLADKIRGVLAVENPKAAGLLTGSALVDELHKGGRAKKLMWLYNTPVPAVRFKNGGEAEDKYMQAVMLCYANMTSFGVSDRANSLVAELNTEDLNRFAAEMFSRWLAGNAESKKKWVMNFAAIHGGNEIIDVFLHCIKGWAENMRGAIAAEAVRALAMNGSPQALMSVDNMAHKFKQKQVRNAAAEALDSAAEALGITADQLADRIVPDLGFDENMQQVFDYGTRSFKVFLTPSLELEVYDENDKKLKNLPVPGKRDEEELAKKSNSEFKAMKKQLKNVISIQKMRMETTLLADRRWEKTAWENLFVKNPVMHSFAIGLIWASYDNNSLLQTFRYTEEGTFSTADEDDYELPENAEIGLVHPIDIDGELCAVWKEQLDDYEITQPIEQLDRPVYRISEDEIGKLDLKRFEGRMINGMSLLGRTNKYGWQKGSVQDAGCFYTFHREDITKRTKDENGKVTLEGNGVQLSFEGMYVSGDNSDVKIESVRFYKPGTISFGSYVYDCADDDKAIPLEKISARYFSEIVNQLEMILKN